MLTSILTAIGAIASIVGAGYGIFKYITWKLEQTPEQKKESIDKSVDDEEASVKSSGRPQA